MDLFLEILKYTLPSLIVFLTVYVILLTYFNDQEKKRQFKSALQNKEIITPIRFQAYERIILFLERISPDSLIMRVSQPGMTSRQLQTEMHSAIRAEYEHNLSQQLYISPKAWEQVKNARTGMIKLINEAAEKVTPESAYIYLSKELLDLSVQEEENPVSGAINSLKAEVQKLF
jgi:hypothetical protein